jgi:hypothetical protein
MITKLLPEDFMAISINDDDEGITLVSMKVAGQGNKPLKRWISKLESAFDDKPCDSKM